MSKGLPGARKPGWRHRLAVGWLVVLGIAAASAHLLPAHYLSPDLLGSNAPPLTPGHWLGTDPQGQDTAAALWYGARTTLLVSLPAAVLAAVLGTGLGLVAGYWGNSQLRFATAYWVAIGGAILLCGLFEAPGAASSWFLVVGVAALSVGKLLTHLRLMRRQLALPVDALLMAAITLLATLPRLLLVLTVAAATEPTLVSLVALMTFTSWTQSARLVRAQVHRVRQLPYLEAAQAAGLPPWRIMWRHLLPNAWFPVVTTLPLSVALLINLEATLSFLGVGLPPETPSWGRILALSRLAPSSWWLLVFPGLCLLATTLALRQVVAHTTPAPRH